MLAKFIPVTLLVLAAIVTTAQTPWSASAPIPGAAAQSHATPVSVSTTLATAPAVHAASLVARDDYRMNLQDGVTADAYVKMGVAAARNALSILRPAS